MYTFGDALNFFGLSHFHSKKEVRSAVRDAQLATHPDKVPEGEEGAFTQVMSVKRDLEAHLQYRKDKHNDPYSSPFLPAEDAKISLFVIAEETVTLNDFRTQETLQTIRRSEHLKEALSQRDEGGNTPLHFAAEQAARCAHSKSANNFFDGLYDIAIEQGFDFTTTNNKGQTVSDIFKEYYPEGNFGIIEDTISEAMLNKALALIEKTINTCDPLPAGLEQIKEKFNQDAFKNATPAARLKICQDILSERESRYEGLLGSITSFFANRSICTQPLYEAIINFDPTKTNTMQQLEQTINSAIESGTPVKQIGYENILALENAGIEGQSNGSPRLG